MLLFYTVQKYLSKSSVFFAGPLPHKILESYSVAFSRIHLLVCCKTTALKTCFGKAFFVNE